MYGISPPLLSSPVVAGFHTPSIPRDARRGGTFIISLHKSLWERHATIALHVVESVGILGNCIRIGSG